MKNLEDPQTIWKLAIALLVIQATYFLILIRSVNGNLTNSGTFGDSFGALNTTFTGLAFLGVLHSLALQRKQIRESQEENKRLQTLQVKREFEQTFFQLLALFETTIERLTFANKSFRRQFADYSDDVYAHIHTYDKDAYAKERPLKDTAVESGYLNFYHHNESVLGQYFRTLYHVFRYVDKSQLTTEEKKYYADLCRAHLSTDELHLLYFNGFCAYGKNFKTLIERYGILKHISQDVRERPGFSARYNPAAYEE
jgi:hypothetical protein